MTEITPVEAPVTEPAVADVTPEAPEAPEAPADPAYDWSDSDVQTRAQEALAHIERWGSPEDVSRAVEIDKALQTEAGVTSLFVQAGRSLGLSDAQLDALFAPASPVVTEPVEEEDPDRVLTMKEARELFAKELATQQTQTAEQAAQTQRETLAQSTLAETFTTLGVTDEVEKQALLAAADKFHDGSLDPERIRASLRKGFAELERVANARRETYLRGKLEGAAALPSSIGAASPGSVSLPEPQTVAEALVRARKQLGLSAQ